MNKILQGKWLYLISGILLILLILSNSGRPVETDWRFDFTAQSQLPYGCEIMRKNLQFVFPDRTIRTSDRTVYETLQDTLNTPGLYLFINDTFEPDEYDIEVMMNYIRNGGIAFVSAFAYSYQFQDSTDIHFTNSFQYSHWDSIKFETASLNTGGGYSVTKFSYPGVYLNDETDLSKIEVYAKNNLGEPVLFSKKYGYGRIYFHLFPIGFSNYYMTERDAADFGYKSLSFLPEKDVIWDENYKTGRIMIKTPLRYILSEPHLAWSYYLLLLAAVIFIFLHGKREQRIIPVIKPFVNSSIEYYKRTALLRKHRDTNKSPVQSLLYVFSARVASHFKLSGNIFSDENVSIVKSVSGQAGLIYQQLEQEFKRVSKSEKPKDEMQSLIRTIDNFYKLTGIYAKRRYRI